MNRLFLESFAIATILTAVSYPVGLMLGGENYTFSPLETFSVWTSYACTYLCVKQSRWNYPIGAISVAALSLLFYINQLYGSMALNLYLIPTLIYGWYRWRPDPITRPVTTVDSVWWPVYLGLAGVTWAVMAWLSKWLTSPLPFSDSMILVGSILAQFLLDNKKIETWAIWAIVNVFAIYTYWNAGLYILAIQFVFFLANTLYGFISWRKSYVFAV